MNVHRTSAPGANPEVWRIDEPTVNAPETPIPNLLLNPGDAVTFKAGGYVQTGVRTWKPYVNPSDSFHYGTVKLPCGVPYGLVAGPDYWDYWVKHPISDFVPGGTPYVVPLAPESTLIIGYADEQDAYSDNKYGTPGGPKNPGNAWVEVTVNHAIRYENHFHNTLHRPLHKPELDYLKPDNSGWPEMRAGSNRHSKEAPPLIDADGVTIQAQTDGSDTNPLASRTVYLLSKDLEAAGHPGFSAAGFLRAELEFDTPNAPEGGDVTKGWGVALNFKNGDAMDGQPDGTNDTRWGPTCQFVEGGHVVNFHMTTGPAAAVDFGTMRTDYHRFARARTRFKLALQICRDDKGVTLSYGELYINDAIVKRGTLTATPPLTTASDPNQITAAGFAIVTQTGSPVQARFRSFTLQYQSGGCASCQGNLPVVDQAPVTYSGN